MTRLVHLAECRPVCLNTPLQERKRGGVLLFTFSMMELFALHFLSEGADDGACHSFIEKVKSGPPTRSIETVTRQRGLVRNLELLSKLNIEFIMVNFDQIRNKD